LDIGKQAKEAGLKDPLLGDCRAQSFQRRAVQQLTTKRS
jgi:hypothetical protein